MIRIGSRAVVAALLVAAIGQVDAALAAFPGENGKILFVRSNQQYVDYRLHLMEPDGTAISRTEVAAASTTDPEWSPDGTRVVLERTGGFLIADANGREVTTIRPGWEQVDNPAWSPDGDQLVYDYAHPAECQWWYCVYDFGLRRINLDGNGDRLLLPYGREPAWSPDGGRIAFTATGNSGFEDIWVMDADGSHVTNLSNNPAPEEAPSWSPDGRRIVFQRFFGSNLNSDVYVMNDDGTGQVNITTNPAPEGNAAWSPDGNWILFARAGVIYRVDPTGGLISYVSGDGHDGSPDWQPVVNSSPDCSGAAADPTSLWPPNKQLRAVALSGATDPDGDEVTLHVSGVTHDETGPPGWTPGSSPDEVLLRAERDPKGDGRLYTVAFEATDEHGASCTGEATVAVPRHKP